MEPSPVTRRPPWQPLGPPAAVISFRPWVRLVPGVLMAVILAGLVIGVVDAVASGDPGGPFENVHGAGVAIGWVVVAVLGGLLVAALGLLVRLRIQLWPDGYVARAFFRSYELGLTDLESIDVRRGRQNPRNPVPATPVLAVRSRDRAGRRRGFLLTSSYQQVDRALPVLDEWVRRRPELVTAAARPSFVARGVLPA